MFTAGSGYLLPAGPPACTISSVRSARTPDQLLAGSCPRGLGMSGGRRQVGSRAACWLTGSGGKTRTFFPITGPISVSGMSHPLSLVPAFALAVPPARSTLSVPHVTPNLLILPISLLLTLQSFATTSSPPESPRLGQVPPLSSLIFPIPSLHPNHTKSRLPSHWFVSIITTRCHLCSPVPPRHTVGTQHVFLK